MFSASNCPPKGLPFSLSEKISADFLLFIFLKTDQDHLFGNIMLRPYQHTSQPSLSSSIDIFSQNMPKCPPFQLILTTNPGEHAPDPL